MFGLMIFGANILGAPLGGLGSADWFDICKVSESWTAIEPAPIQQVRCQNAT